MKKARFTNERIAFALEHVESGVPVEEICRKLGVSQPTFYRWKKKFDGMGVEEFRRLKTLEEENKRLKSLISFIAGVSENGSGSDRFANDRLMIGNSTIFVQPNEYMLDDASTPI